MRSSPVAAWMLNYYGYTSPEEGVRKLALQTLDQAKETKPPINLKALFPYRKVLKVAYKENINDATLRVEESGFVIEVRPRQPETRTRFSVAHELGHTFFFDIHNCPPRRIGPTGSGSLDEERLCNIAAAELLMPAHLLREKASMYPSPGQSYFSMNTFRFLLDVFVVSREAFARRIVQDLFIWKSIIIGCRWLPKASVVEHKTEKTTETWRVVWYAIPVSLRSQLYLPAASKRPRVHLSIVEHAYQCREAQEGIEEPNKLRLGNSKLALNFLDGRRIVYALPLIQQGLQLPLKDMQNDLTESIQDEDIMLRRRSEIIICIPLVE